MTTVPDSPAHAPAATDAAESTVEAVTAPVPPPTGRCGACTAATTPTSTAATAASPAQARSGTRRTPPGLRPGGRLGSSPGEGGLTSHAVPGAGSGAPPLPAPRSTSTGWSASEGSRGGSHMSPSPDML
ncbi:hypothetical protein [Nocardia wallacei]|uniref:hypothetical protein n=1 Tax=Nocardia wallacei TaxID=480035 RepID=UPI002458FA88|nr:hypothetical protein [Nocardia wallacei]